MEITNYIKIKYEQMEDILYAFYDLAVSPATFDIVKFILMAEISRKRKNKKKIHIIIVPGMHDGFRSEIPEHNLTESHWRVRNILVGCCSLLESCSGFTYCTNRKEAYYYVKNSGKSHFPENYSTDHPVSCYLTPSIKNFIKNVADWPSLEPPKYAQNIIYSLLKSFGENVKVVTINLRDSSTQPSRNSNLHEWGKVCQYLIENGYKVIVIRDSEKAYSELPAEFINTYDGREFIWNIPLRAALYEQTYINLFVSNGPATLSMHNKDQSRCLIFKMLCENTSSASSAFFKGQGIEIGGQHIYAGPYNRIVWEEDTYEIIINEFNKMKKDISFETQITGKIQKL